MSAPWPEPRVVRSSTWGSSSRGGAAWSWTTARHSRSDPATCSTSRRGTTPGSRVPSRTCRCISRVPTSTLGDADRTLEYPQQVVHRRQQHDRAQCQGAQHQPQCGRGGGGARNREVGRQDVGILAQRPAPQDQRHLRSEEHTSELQSRLHLVCRLLLEKITAFLALFNSMTRK